MKSKVLLISVLSSLFFYSGCQKSSDESPRGTPPSEQGSGDPETPATPPSEAPNPTPNSPLPNGTWGNDGMTMIVHTDFVELRLGCGLGKIEGQIRPNENGRFLRKGTISFFNNDTGMTDTFQATYDGIASPDKTVLGIRATYDRPDIGTADETFDYVIKKDYDGPMQMCAI